MKIQTSAQIRAEAKAEYDDYRYTIEEAAELRARFNTVAQRIKHLEGPDGPKTPKGFIPAAIKREIKVLTAEKIEIGSKLQKCPPSELTWSQALRRLLREHGHIARDGKGAVKDMIARLNRHPLYALENSDSYALHIALGNKASDVLAYTSKYILEYGKTAETLQMVFDLICRSYDVALENVFDNASNLHNSTCQAQNMVNLAKLEAAKRYCERVSFTIFSGQHYVDAYALYHQEG